MNLDIRDLELVREVVARGSLTAAARRLHVTQSALSHRLLDLEGRVGAPLFRREARRMVPTRAGERLAESAGRLLGELRATWDDVRRIAGAGVALLRVGTACYTGYSWLAAVLERFAAEHPGVEVQVDAGATGDAVDAVRRGTLDVALTPGPLRDDALDARPLFEDELVALLPPGHALAARSHLEPADFRDAHVIVYSADPARSLFLGGILAPAGVTPRKATGVPLTEAILELVQAGQGVTVLARWAAADRIERGTLVARPLGSGGRLRTWHAVTRRADRARPDDPVETFVALLQDELPARLAPRAAGPRAAGARAAGGRRAR